MHSLNSKIIEMHCNFTVDEVLVHGNEFFFANSGWYFLFSFHFLSAMGYLFCTMFKLPGAHLLEVKWMRCDKQIILSFRDKSVNDHVDISTKKEQQTKWVSYLTPKANEEVKKQCRAEKLRWLLVSVFIYYRSLFIFFKASLVEEKK